MIYWLIGAGLLAAIVALVVATVIIRRLFAALPKPETFAEGQRLVFGWLAAFAGIFCGIAAEEMIALLMWGGWSKAEEHTIVVIFGWTLGGFIACMAVVMIGLLVGGPVGRFKGEASPRGLTWDLGSKDEAPTAEREVNVSVTDRATPKEG